MTQRRRIVVADAPGGPHPSSYLPSLLTEFDVDAVWLAVEAAEARADRATAMRQVAATGGTVTAVSTPEEVAEALAVLVVPGRTAGVVAFSERVVHLAQQAAVRAGLPGNPPAVLEALQDKRVQRARLRSHGVPVPRQWELREPADVAEAEQQAPFPAVLKPSVGMGSLATFRVASAQELAPAWRRARELALADPRVAHHRPVMLLEEELVGDPARATGGLGDYLSVEVLVVDGEPAVLAVSDKLPFSRPYRENGHIIPTLRPAAETDEVVAQVLAAHAALGIRFGATHTEVKLTADGPRIIEVNGRPGGKVADLLMLAAGYDLPLNLARLSAGMPADTAVTCERWALYATPQPPVGRHLVDVAPAREDLLRIPGTRGVHHLVPAGQLVDSANGTACQLAKISAVADTAEELMRIAGRLADPALFKLHAAATGTGSAAEERDSVRVFIGEPSSVDPSNGFEHDGALLLRFLADPLVDYSADTGEARPAAAESWEVSADGTRVDFRLRPGVRFHHGREVTAADYVYSLSRVVRPATGSKLAYHLSCIEGFDAVRSGEADTLSGVTAVDPRLLRVRLNRPFHEVAAVFGHRVTAAVPQELADGDRELFRVHPVSTGPYRIIRPWVPGQGLTMARFDGYYGANEAFPDGGSGYLDRLEFRIYEELEDAYRDWHRGELDVVKVPPARIPDALPFGERFRRTPCALMQYVGFPTEVAPFDNPVVRRAAAMAIDRQGVIDSAFSGTRPLAQRILPPMLRTDDDADLTGVRYDPEGARALLAEHGIAPVTTYFTYNAGLGHDGWVESVIDQLNTNLGWRITPRPMVWPEFLAWLKQADTVFRMTWAIDYPSADNFLFPLFHSASVGSSNYTRYRSTEADALIDRARGTADPVSRRKLYAEAEARVCADLPLLPLWYGVQYHLVNLDEFEVEGPVVDLFGEPVLRSFRPRG
ncbi:MULTISPECIES: ABC transporter substrate-binding protein [Kitasatospora]|uniref:ATP-grasp domain-containing protein n=1 Tax=Kitasatospora cystarginea TaxID=58350 RepID=A0ABN3DEZ1_9ACTN